MVYEFSENCKWLPFVNNKYGGFFGKVHWQSQGLAPSTCAGGKGSRTNAWTKSSADNECAPILTIHISWRWISTAIVAERGACYRPSHRASIRIANAFLRGFAVSALPDAPVNWWPNKHADAWLVSDSSEYKLDLRKISNMEHRYEKWWIYKASIPKRKTVLVFIII